MLRTVVIALLGVVPGWMLGISASQTIADVVEPGDRVVFMGDSNTYAGHYVNEIAAQWKARFSEQETEFINCGLSSETACGLSEPAHPFPRPNAQERIDRVIGKLKPDVLVICYGMNDGIYHPFDALRFEAYQEGIRALVGKGREAGAKVILLTPPPFDTPAVRKRGKLRPRDAGEFNWMTIYEGYDDVLKRYSQWILEQASAVDQVIDIRTPFVEFLRERRQANSEYGMTGDGIHFNRDGHRVIAKVILRAWDMDLVEVPDSIRSKVEQSQFILRDSSLSHVGHQRPGVKPGLPWAEAQRRSSELLNSLESP